MLDSLNNKKNIEVGLRCYGHQLPVPSAGGCKDTKLELILEQIQSQQSNKG